MYHRDDGTFSDTRIPQESPGTRIPGESSSSGVPATPIEQMGFITPPAPLHHPPPPPPPQQPLDQRGPQNVPRMPVEQLLLQPGRDRLPFLDPSCRDGTTWFIASDNGISKCILRMIHNLLRHPYPRFRDMPLEDQEYWFYCFALDFNWSPAMMSVVKKEFRTRAGRVFSSHVYSWKETWINEGKQHSQMPNGLLQGYITHWDKEGTQSVSVTNRGNRLSQREGKGIATTNSGSRSSFTRQGDLRQKIGREPTPIEIIEDLHTNKKTKEIQDQVAKELVETAKKRYQEVRSSQETPEDDDLDLQTQYRVVDEVTKKSKGRVYGFGNMASYCFPGAGSRHHRDPMRNEEMRRKEAELAAVKEQMAELARKDAEREAELRRREAERDEEMRQMREEQMRMQREMDEKMNAFMESMSRRYGGH